MPSWARHQRPGCQLTHPSTPCRRLKAPSGPVDVSEVAQWFGTAYDKESASDDEKEKAEKMEEQRTALRTQRLTEGL